MENTKHLRQAVQLALDGEWDAPHKIVQEFSDHYANWIHAVLHKIEGDEWNSKYWYQRTNGQQYENYAEPEDELLVIKSELEN
ncbi:MAG TPA: hypothetical protein VLM20_06430 [Methylophilaceae bacterium]|nr:hypothetical protein [Methylophilaceae bacterium]